MSASTQQKTTRTIGISLVTMLALALTQELIQFSHLLNDDQIRLLLWLLYPLYAILCGAAARFMTGSLWSAVIAAAAAFTTVILVLFNPAALIYAPVYLGLSLTGYASASLFQKRALRKPAV